MRHKLVLLVSLTVVSFVPAIASAHVVVRPNQVGIGEDQTFTTAVPNEKDQPVTALKLIIPSGLKDVTPNVKPGWSVTEQKTGDGTSVTEIDWTGGQIPIGQRDEFVFDAQAPAKPTTLDWKAYQTYADGTVVAWTQTPTGSDDDSLTPYSTTQVVDDLAPHAATTSADTKADIALALGIVAILVSGVSLALRRRS